MAERDRKQRSISQQTEQPPQPPPIARKLQFRPLQLIGVPLLMVLPILALFGVFGESFTTSRAQNEALALRVDFPTRCRYRMVSNLVVTVTNLTQQSPVTVTVSFDRAYMDNFAGVTFIPSAARMTPDAYEVELSGVGAGETQVIEVEMEAEQYWRHAGGISASLPGGEPVQLAVGTMIYP